MKAWVYVAVAAVVIVIIAVVVSKPDPSAPEDQVRQTLREAVAAAERRDLGDLLDFVSERFKAEGMTRDNLKGILFVELRRGTWTRVFLVNTEVEIIADGEARVRTGAVLAAGDDIESVQDVVTDAGSYRFDIFMMREEEDEWRVVTATWERTSLRGLLGGP